jgi:hypothetical protein
MRRRRPVKQTLSGLADGMPGQMKKLLFASAKVLAMYFSPSVPTINRILKTHPGFQKFSERLVLDELINGQNRLKCEIPEGLLNVLRNDEST